MANAPGLVSTRPPLYCRLTSRGSNAARRAAGGWVLRQPTGRNTCACRDRPGPRTGGAAGAPLAAAPIEKTAPATTADAAAARHRARIEESKCPTFKHVRRAPGTSIAHDAGGPDPAGAGRHRGRRSALSGHLGRQHVRVPGPSVAHRPYDLDAPEANRLELGLEGDRLPGAADSGEPVVVGALGLRERPAQDQLGRVHLPAGPD